MNREQRPSKKFKWLWFVDKRKVKFTYPILKFKLWINEFFLLCHFLMLGILHFQISGFSVRGPFPNSKHSVYLFHQHHTFVTSFLHNANNYILIKYEEKPLKTNTNRQQIEIISRQHHFSGISKKMTGVISIIDMFFWNACGNEQRCF